MASSEFPGPLVQYIKSLTQFHFHRTPKAGSRRPRRSRTSEIMVISVYAEAQGGSSESFSSPEGEDPIWVNDRKQTELWICL